MVKMVFNYYDQYSQVYEQSAEKYGKANTVVWMEVGSFYEMYGIGDNIDDDQGGMREGTMKHICNIMDIVLTKKNKSNPACDRSNPFIAGFPSIMLDKYTDLMINAGFTIVLIEQQKTKIKSIRSGKESQVITRNVTRIISPGTHVPSETSPGESENGRKVMAIRLEANPSKGASFGIACTDMFTSDTVIHEPAATCKGDPNMIREELQQFITCHCGLGTGGLKEIVVFSLMSGSSTVVQGMFEALQDICGAGVLFHNHLELNTAEKKVLDKLEYQETLLKKVWPAKCASGGLFRPLEVFHLERSPLAASALACLLQFVYDHGENLAYNLKIPTWFSDAHLSAADYKPVSLLLNNTTATQLDILPAQGHKGVGFLGMFNKCLTVMGRRLFRSRLLTPSCDKQVLTDRYNKVFSFLVDQRYNQVRTSITHAQLPDIENLVRRLCMRKISANELWALAKSAQAASQIMKQITEYFGDPSLEPLTTVLTMLQPAACLLNDSDVLTKLGAISPNAIIFSTNVNPVMDQHLETLTKCFTSCTQFVKELNEEAGGIYKLECSQERDGQITFFVSVTQKRHSTACSSTTGGSKSSELIRLPGSSSISTNMKLIHPVLRDAGQQATVAKSEFDVLCKSEFESLVNQLASDDNMITALHELCQQLAELDVYSTSAYLADKHGWVQPEFSSPGNDTLSPDTGSWIEATQLRHPIIEKLLAKNGHWEYVPNNVSLGFPTKGMLLYGMNASGKSSLMKSVGLAVVMAQAGFFVPASKFVFEPFQTLFSRITSTDNLYQGKSTFTNEILELRNILARANMHSLVLGDELCSGTESLSAMSIVGAGIQRLSDVGCCYLFATHLHELSSSGVLSGVKQLRIFHLGVQYDSKTETLVYDRILKDGPGTALYGLEVCRSLDLDPEFMKAATAIRRKLTGDPEDVVVKQQSRYNASLYMDLCELCGDARSVDTHHLAQQSECNSSNGLIQGRFHKNARFNLVSLCKKCHQKVHHQAEEPDQTRRNTEKLKRVMTSAGPQLVNIIVQKKEKQQ